MEFIDVEQLTDGFRLRAKPSEVEAWKDAAAAEGVSVSEWLRARAAETPTVQDATRAHAAVAAAIRDGHLTPAPCELCGQEAVAHHDDYSKPLEVRWLCRAHHSQWHREHPTGIDWGSVTVRFTDEEHAELVAAARQNRRSLQKEIVFRLFSPRLEGVALGGGLAAGEQRDGKEEDRLRTDPDPLARDHEATVRPPRSAAAPAPAASPPERSFRPDPKPGGKK